MLTVASCGDSSPVSAIAVKRLDVELGDRALVFDGDRGDAGLGQLPGKAAELLGELHVGVEALRLLGGQRRHVDRVRDGAGQQKIRHLLGDLQRHVLLRLGCRGAEMRRRDDIVAPEQRVLDAPAPRQRHRLPRRRHDRCRGRRRGPSSTTRPPRAQLMRRTPRFILAIARGVDQVFASPRSAGCAGDEIGAGKQLVETTPSRCRDRRRARATGTGRRRSTFIRSPSARSATIEPTLPQPIDAERLAGQLDPHEARLLPFAGLGRAVGRRDLRGTARTACAIVCSAAVIELP